MMPVCCKSIDDGSGREPCDAEHFGTDDPILGCFGTWDSSKPFPTDHQVNNHSFLAEAAFNEIMEEVEHVNV